MSGQVITANRLDDGTVVYLGDEKSWSPQLANAKVAADEDEAVVLMGIGDDAENQGIVVGAYLIPVEVVDGVIAPVRLREDIRADGPTRRTDPVPAT